MSRKLRNVTVTLEEDVAQWARIEAARKDTSVSRLLGQMLKARMLEEEGYEKAMRRALSRRPFLRTGGRYMSREEAHRKRTRRSVPVHETAKRAFLPTESESSIATLGMTHRM
jgi:hypothetical protein